MALFVSWEIIRGNSNELKESILHWTTCSAIFLILHPVRNNIFNIVAGSLRAP